MKQAMNRTYGWLNLVTAFELVLWAGPELVAKPGSAHALFMCVLEDELRDAGIGIPYPQRDLHVRSGTLKVALKGKTPPKQP